jgi:hypothetical protein
MWITCLPAQVALIPAPPIHKTHLPGVTAALLGELIRYLYCKYGYFLIQYTDSDAVAVHFLNMNFMAGSCVRRA